MNNKVSELELRRAFDGAMLIMGRDPITNFPTAHREVEVDLGDSSALFTQNINIYRKGGPNDEIGDVVDWEAHLDIGKTWPSTGTLMGARYFREKSLETLLIRVNAELGEGN